MKMKTASDLREFLTGYIDCALWSSTDEDGLPLDASYERSDIAFGSPLSMARDCKDFMRGNAELLSAYRSEIHTNGLESEFSYAGHDFWLTRNGHGTGFWDRGLGHVGSDLTDAAHVYGSSDIYIGDDGNLHVT